MSFHWCRVGPSRSHFLIGMLSFSLAEVDLNVFLPDAKVVSVPELLECLITPCHVIQEPAWAPNFDAGSVCCCYS